MSLLLRGNDVIVFRLHVASHRKRMNECVCSLTRMLFISYRPTLANMQVVLRKGKSAIEPEREGKKQCFRAREKRLSFQKQTVASQRGKANVRCEEILKYRSQA